MTIICTECQCFEVGGMSVVKDGKEQWVCLDCYRELYAKRKGDPGQIHLLSWAAGKKGKKRKGDVR